MNLLRVVARPLLAAPFIADGVDALMHPRFHVERAAGVRPLIDKATDAVGLEPLTDQQLAVATRVTGAVTVVAGLRFALGSGQMACHSLRVSRLMISVWRAATPLME